MHRTQIAPSLLAADHARFGEEARACVAAGAEWLHIDVMDGQFVPNLSFGAEVVRALKPHCPETLFDVHLMVERPENYLAPMVAAGAGALTVHVEACVHLQRTLAAIRAAGLLAGVALNPATVPDGLRYVSDDLDLVLVMSVNPGFGGQAFLPLALEKVAALSHLREAWGGNWRISVDGGVDASNIGSLSARGASVFVAGSSVFKHAGGVAGGIAALKEAAG